MLLLFLLMLLMNLLYVHKSLPPNPSVMAATRCVFPYSLNAELMAAGRKCRPAPLDVPSALRGAGAAAHHSGCVGRQGCWWWLPDLLQPGLCNAMCEGGL